MISTCKCYPTLHFSSIALPVWIMILMKTCPPFSTLPACPVIENSCSKPSVFVNFQLVLNVFPINGRLGLRLIDLVVNTGMVWQYYWEWDDNSKTIYSMLYQENVKNYDQSFP